MSEDPRCCGSGTCIIDDEGRCWCGQQWNGEAMCHPDSGEVAQSTAPKQQDDDS
ncbi:MAG: hypothetical protein H7255_20330 [Ramlibacter sp.]|nr:hypothetical protein [Ramlibacter sp.]